LRFTGIRPRTFLPQPCWNFFRRPSWGTGRQTESGFFYDFYRPTPLRPRIWKKSRRKCRSCAAEYPYAREFLPRDQGLAEFKKEGDFMKCHFIEQFTKPDEKISIYRTGKFTDFCRGPHILLPERSRRSSCLTLRARIG